LIGNNIILSIFFVDLNDVYLNKGTSKTFWLLVINSENQPQKVRRDKMKEGLQTVILRVMTRQDSCADPRRIGLTQSDGPLSRTAAFRLSALAERSSRATK